MDRDNVVDNDFAEEERRVIDECETEEPVIFRKGEEYSVRIEEKDTIFPYARKIFRRSRGMRGRSSLGIF